MNIKKIKNKKIYLSPCNDITYQLHNFLKSKIDFDFFGYIDSQKEGEEIQTAEKIDHNFDFIIIASPNYSNEIAQKLNDNNVDNTKIIYCYKLLSYTFQTSNFLNYPIQTYYKNKRKLLEYFRPHKFRWWPYKIKFFMARLGFQLTPNEVDIRALKNKHKNDRAFIIGNGPSLNADDLGKLKNEITFAANKIYLAYDNTQWRPTYYNCIDDLVTRQNIDEIEKIQGSIKLFPLRLLDYAPRFSNSLYYNCGFFRGGHVLPPKDSMFSPLYLGPTVMFTMTQIAFYMGFKEIYYIGVDFSFDVPSKYIHSEKEVICDGEINHFHKDYRKPGEKWNIPKMDKQEKAFELLKKHADKRGIKIINATRGGKLEVFERIDFDELF